MREWAQKTLINWRWWLVAVPLIPPLTVIAVVQFMLPFIGRACVAIDYGCSRAETALHRLAPVNRRLMRWVFDDRSGEAGHD